MPSSRKMILKHVMSGICTKMNRKMKIPSDVMETPLNRCLHTFDITLLGIIIPIDCNFTSLLAYYFPISTFAELLF